MTRSLVWIACLCCITAGCARTIPPRAGMVVDRSVRLTAGLYRISAGGGPNDTVIYIRDARDVTLDFAGVVLDGAPDDQAMPDQFRGTALRIEGGRNITLKNLTARGYKLAVHARNVDRLRIIDCDFSYNYRPRLKSTPEKEDTSDWLSFHHNDNDEWLRYGAGIYLHDCDRAEVSGCTITGGFNGLLMTRCDDGRFWNNNFSFNSGVGIGLYRSNRNRVMHNKLDWNVRGYSHGVYHRGQDSAAILVYEQSCDNTVAYNSATHSGDGLFLWAGQTTMDTGQGGSNDNLIAVNDFSFAPTNGVEVTFSRNHIINNTIHGCDHGVWGGYSFETSIVGNSFRDNRIGIAIEHGQENLIAINTFEGDRTGIKLWQNPRQDPNWKYPRLRDTRSRNYRLIGNTFADVPQPQAISDTQDVHVSNNEADVGSALAMRTQMPDPLPGAQRTLMPPDHPRGREYILVDEWGPYDFRSPRLWPREHLADGRLRFEILGPGGRWRLVSQRGAAALSDEAGDVPGELIISLAPDTAGDLDIQLEYTGGQVVSPFGKTFASGEPYRFGFRKRIAAHRRGE